MEITLLYVMCLSLRLRRRLLSYFPFSISICWLCFSDIVVAAAALLLFLMLFIFPFLLRCVFVLLLRKVVNIFVK